MCKNLKFGLLAALAMLSSVFGTAAHAAVGDNPIVVLLQSVDLTTVAASLAAITLIIVAIALTMKGPDVSKRVIRKV